MTILLTAIYTGNGNGARIREVQESPQSWQGHVRHPVHRTDRETVRAGAEQQGRRLYRAANIQGAPVSGGLRNRKTTDSPAAEELNKENTKQSYYMEQALSYFDHFKDGSYPIDNNLAEHQVHPFTAMRKVIQHYGSDEGAEMAAVYLSVVSTVKLAGVSVWRFLGDFFGDVVTGGRKHFGHLRLLPA